MKTFPHHALSRGYLLGYPQKPILDSGVVAMQLGNGVLRSRDELGADVTARDLRYECLTAADIAILENFRADHRATTFYWADNKSYLTYECRFDPANPPQVVPHAEVPNHYDYAARLLPVLPTVSVDMLVGHWKMNDDAADTDVADASGNGHTGTASANTEDLSVAGKVGTALEFINTSSRYVAVSDAADLRLTDGGTILMWVKWEGTRAVTGGATSTLAGKAPSDWRLWIHNASGAVGVIIQSDQSYSENAALVQDTWRHIAVVIDAVAEEVRFYADAQDVTSDGGAGTMPAGGSGSVHLGAYTSTSGFFDGVIDDVRIYRRPLTALEIAAIYNSGSGTESAIVA